MFSSSTLTPLRSPSPSRKQQEEKQQKSSSPGLTTPPELDSLLMMMLLGAQQDQEQQQNSHVAEISTVEKEDSFQLQGLNGAEKSGKENSNDHHHSLDLSSKIILDSSSNGYDSGKVESFEEEGFVTPPSSPILEEGGKNEYGSSATKSTPGSSGGGKSKFTPKRSPARPSGVREDTIDLIRKYASLSEQSKEGMEIAQRIFDSTGYYVGALPLTSIKKSQRKSVNRKLLNDDFSGEWAEKIIQDIKANDQFSPRSPLTVVTNAAASASSSSFRRFPSASASSAEIIDPKLAGRGTTQVFKIEEIDHLIKSSLKSGGDGEPMVQITGCDVVSFYIHQEYGQTTHIRYVVRTTLLLHPIKEEDQLRCLTVTVNRRYKSFLAFDKAIREVYKDDPIVQQFPYLPKSSWRRSLSEAYASNLASNLNDYLGNLLASSAPLATQDPVPAAHPLVIAFLTREATRGVARTDGGEEEWEFVQPSKIKSKSNDKVESDLFKVGAGGRCLRRAPSEFGGLHISLVLEPRPNTLRLAELDQCVKSLVEQDFRCAACACDIGVAMETDSGDKPGQRSAKLCHYTEQWMCSACFKGDDPRESGIARALPTRILHHWDFRPYPVCSLAREFLDRIYEHPLLCISACNPKLFEKVKPLQHARFLRLQLMNAREFLDSSSDMVTAAEAQPGISSAKKHDASCRELLLNVLGQDRIHLALSTELYSLQDLFDLSGCDENGIPKSKKSGNNLIELLSSVVNTAATHITLRCEWCKSRGSICKICDKPSDGSRLYPFQIMEVTSCRRCLNLYHVECFIKHGGEAKCPTCLNQEEE